MLKKIFTTASVQRVPNDKKSLKLSIDSSKFTTEAIIWKNIYINQDLVKSSKPYIIQSS